MAAFLPLLHQGLPLNSPISIVSALIVAVIVSGLVGVAFAAPLSGGEDAKARPQKRRSRKLP